MSSINDDTMMFQTLIILNSKYDWLDQPSFGKTDRQFVQSSKAIKQKNTSLEMERKRHY